MPTVTLSGIRYRSIANGSSVAELSFVLDSRRIDQPFAYGLSDSVDFTAFWDPVLPAFTINGQDARDRVEIIAVAWEEDGKARNSTVMLRDDRTSPLSGERPDASLFLLAGDALPRLATYAAMRSWLDASILSQTTEGPFAAGEPVNYAVLPLSTWSDDDTVRIDAERITVDFGETPGDHDIADFSGQSWSLPREIRVNEATVTVQKLGFISQGGEADITLIGVEEIRGTFRPENGFGSNDRFFAGPQDMIFLGNGGSDLFFGKAGGRDHFDGLDPVGDRWSGTLSYERLGLGSEGIHVDSARGLVLGAAGRDSFESIAIIRGSRGDDTFIAGGASTHSWYQSIRFEGLDGNDTFRTRRDTEFATYEGGTGNDLFIGRGGVERARGGLGDDVFRLAGGDDRAEGGGGADVLRGGSGNDSLSGYGSSADRLFQDGDDRLFGQGGDDYLSGGAGDDYLDGAMGGTSFWARRVTMCCGAAPAPTRCRAATGTIRSMAGPDGMFSCSRTVERPGAT